MVIDKEHNKISSFLPGPNQYNDQRVTLEITQQLQKEFRDVFNGIGCFNRTFSFQLKLGTKTYQAPPRCMAYALQKPFKEELE